MGRRMRAFLVLALVVVLLVGTTGCIAGTGRYTEERRANFWAGLFHGVISPVTLFISLFTGNIDMYERENVGWGYDCGFFLGLALVLGGGCGSRARVWRAARRKKTEKIWGTIGEEIEQEVKAEVQQWLRSKEGDEGGGDENWKEIGRKIEEKVRRKLKEWADKD